MDVIVGHGLRDGCGGFLAVGLVDGAYALGGRGGVGVVGCHGVGGRMGEDAFVNVWDVCRYFEEEQKGSGIGLYVGTSRSSCASSRCRSGCGRRPPGRKIFPAVDAGLVQVMQERQWEQKHVFRDQSSYIYVSSSQEKLSVGTTKGKIRSCTEQCDRLRLAARSEGFTVTSADSLTADSPERCQLCGGIATCESRGPPLADKPILI